MKMIVAIIRPEKLDEVQLALAERDVYLMTVTDVRGYRVETDRTVADFVWYRNTFRNDYSDGVAGLPGKADEPGFSR